VGSTGLARPGQQRFHEVPFLICEILMDKKDVPYPFIYMLYLLLPPFSDSF
jgi:hypothetical protein